MHSAVGPPFLWRRSLPLLQAIVLPTCAPRLLTHAARPNICMISYGYNYTKYVLNSAGPELAFARTLLAAGVSTRIGFLPHAMGGYSMYK